MASPNPLAVATQFIKKYYKTISEEPGSFGKFYGSSPSEISIGENATIAQSVSAESSVERFEGASSFELQAIDAQASVNGGILLVVTGQIAFQTTTKQFVQTFFLNTNPNKKGYYVHNDVLRFIDLPAAESTKQQTSSVGQDHNDDVPPNTEPPEPIRSVVSPTPASPPVSVSRVVQESTIPEPPVIPKTASKIPSTEVFDSPGHGTEESKEAIFSLEDTAEEKVGSNSWASKVASKKTQQDATPISTPVTTPANGGSSVPSSPSRESTAPPSAPSNNTATKPEQPAPAKIPVHKRNPDCTLIVKNIDNDTVEPDIRVLFERFGDCSVTVQANRGIAFVDYAAAAPVLAAIAEQPFTLRDRTLEIYQKTATATRRGKNYHRRNNHHNNGRGRGRGSNNNNNNNNNR